MAEFGRVCGGHASLFRAILVSISHLNKLPISGCLVVIRANSSTIVAKGLSDLGSADDLEVEDGLLESTEQPQPDGHNHLRAPCR